MARKSKKNTVVKNASGMYDASRVYSPILNSSQYIRDFDKSIEENLSESDRKTIVSRARQLYANMGAIKNAIQEKAEFTIGDGWHKSTFLGRAKTWGDTATEKVNIWLSRNKVQQALRLISMSIDRDGDCLVVFTKYNNSFKLYSTDLIASRNGSDTVKSGPYNGYPIYDGVIKNKYNEVIAYNLLGKKDDGSEDIQVPVSDCILVQDPEYVDQIRGISGLAQSIPIFEQYKRIVDFEVIGIKNASAYGVQIYAEKQDIPKHTGASTTYPQAWGRTSLPVSSSVGPNVDLKIEELQGGTVNVFRAGSGAKLEVLNSDRPSQNTAAFLMDHCLRQAFLSLRWPVELSYDLNSRGATTKLVISKAVRTIDSRQSLIFRPIWTRMVMSAVSNMINSGELPFNNDWYRWQPDYPSQMSIDTFRDTKSDIESWNKGFMTGQQIANQYGYDYFANLRQKADEIEYAKQLALERNIPLESLIQMTPNGNMVSSNPVDPIINDNNAVDKDNNTNNNANL